MACVFQGQDKILACYNLFDTVLDYPRNSENTDNWKQFMGAICTSIAPPLWSITWTASHRGEWFWVFPSHQICGVSTNSSQFTTTHWVFNKTIYFWWESMELLQILKAGGSRLSSVQMPAMRSWVNHACDQITKMEGQASLWPQLQIQQLNRTGGWTSGNHCLLFTD